MKYGISKNGMLEQVVSVPIPLPDWAKDDATWLAKMFPDLAGWVKVPDDAVNGAKDNGDGTFTNPVIVKPTPPPATTKQQMQAVADQMQALINLMT